MHKRRMSKREKGSLIEKISDVLKAKEYIIFAYIFGSFALEDRFKDVDIGLFIFREKSTPSLRIELNLEGEVADAIHMPVDVWVLNDAPVSFVYNVLKNGILIVDRDRSIRSDFEGLVYKKYFDFQHLRNEYLREIKNAPL